MTHQRWSIAARLAEVAPLVAEVRAFLAEHEVAERPTFATQLVVEEIVSNVARHAFDDAEPHAVDVDVSCDADGITLRVVDDGRPFDPVTAPEPDTDVPLAERPIGGLGLHLVRSMAEDIRYERRDGRNHTELRVPR